MICSLAMHLQGDRLLIFLFNISYFASFVSSRLGAICLWIPSCVTCQFNNDNDKKTIVDISENISEVLHNVKTLKRIRRYNKGKSNLCKMIATKCRKRIMVEQHIMKAMRLWRRMILKYIQTNVRKYNYTLNRISKLQEVFFKGLNNWRSLLKCGNVFKRQGERKLICWHSGRVLEKMLP